MKSFIGGFVLLAVLAHGLLAQDTAKGLLDMASKKAASAKGKSGDEAATILKEAAAMFEQVATRFPGEKEAVAKSHLNVGRIRRRLNDLPAAEAALKEAAASAESRIATEALHDLAAIYRRTKRLEEAQQALDRIVTAFPGEPRQRAEALSRLASLHRAAKRPEAAESALRQILSDHGDLYGPAIGALEDLVSLKIRMGREDDAREVHASHGEALKARFAGTRYESRLPAALDRIAARFKPADDEEE